jgi:hypothetical protein
MPPGVPEPPEVRFPKLIQIDPSGCWVWLGWKSNGYGRFHVNGKDVRAHRWSYERFVGPIPEGHLEANRSARLPSRGGAR